ncbi:endo-1,4-beta-xylanase [Actinocrispum wychmicini]|uniref:Beta-xylanase n=1 Tax=Actinocrispum wychmicini TaxID=1213861 RepID=A0A4R2JD10_9PSEU|nr:endo-1,4-beta-xylanase [Actinocrispum wychmicini]TCO55942.1 endo-1,4-beta-xylanase [Actinocrispum wychmicini]
MRLAVLAAVSTVALIASGVPAVAAGIDLLRGHDWTHFAGAARTADGVQITPLDRWITSQKEGRRLQPNPPVNLAGPHLAVAGDFQVDATMAGINGKSAYLQLYGQLPVIYDEWRQERPSVRVGIVGGRLETAVWDGESNTAEETRTFGAGLSGDVTVSIKRAGGRITLSANGKRLGSVDEHDVFASGTVWFGADAQVGGGWRLAALSASGSVDVVDSPDRTQPTSKKSLRAKASGLDRPIHVGTAIASTPLVDDAAYRAIAGREFDMITPENDMKPQFVQPRRGVFAFAEADTLVDFARANDQAVHAHTLVWFEALPTWMRSAPDKETVMLDHIKAVAGHFAGRVAEWDVVNEPMDEDSSDGLRHNLWWQAMGKGYIAKAFTAARQADPNAVLYLNEYGVEEAGERWDRLYQLVKDLKAAGVPIDGVGFQNHEYAKGDRTPPETFRQHVQALAALGLKVRVSEMDVSANGDSAAVQAKEFAGKLAVCRDEPNCTSFGMWGFTDRYGSTADINNYPPSPGDALPWDRNLRPKKAYTAMLNELN